MPPIPFRGNPMGAVKQYIQPIFTGYDPETQTFTWSNNPSFGMSVQYITYNNRWHPPYREVESADKLMGENSLQAWQAFSSANTKRMNLYGLPTPNKAHAWGFLLKFEKPVCIRKVEWNAFFYGNMSAAKDDDYTIALMRPEALEEFDITSVIYEENYPTRHSGWSTFFPYTLTIPKESQVWGTEFVFALKRQTNEWASAMFFKGGFKLDAVYT